MLSPPAAVVGEEHYQTWLTCLAADLSWPGIYRSHHLNTIVKPRSLTTFLQLSTEYILVRDKGEYSNIQNTL